MLARPLLTHPSSHNTMDRGILLRQRQFYIYIYSYSVIVVTIDVSDVTIVSRVVGSNGVGRISLSLMVLRYHSVALATNCYHTRFLLAFPGGTFPWPPAPTGRGMYPVLAHGDTWAPFLLHFLLSPSWYYCCYPPAKKKNKRAMYSPNKHFHTT